MSSRCRVRPARSPRWSSRRPRTASPSSERRHRFGREDPADDGEPVGHPHNIGVGETVGPVVGKGGKSEITVDLPAGSYEFHCSVPGHEEAGMVGALTVR